MSYKNSTVTGLVLSIMFFFSGLTGQITAVAATTPSLGAAATYGILASTYTNTAAGTVVNGDVGFTTGPAVAPGGVHANYGSGAPYASAGTDQGLALSNLNAQPCTFTFAAGAINLSTDITHGSAGVYTPGVYCSTGAMNIGGPVTLNGSGTYIFRAEGALNSTAGAVVSLAGSASACDVFWTPTQATTLGANTAFVGTIIGNAGITIGANTTWSGRSLAFGGTITTDTTTITVPTCTPATLQVIKKVINNSGGNATAAAFNLHVKNAGIDVAGSPAVGTAAPGTLYSLTAGTYIVSEDANAAYTQSFSGDCDASGNVTLLAGDNKTCTITNNDNPPAPATLQVIKKVINNSGGNATAAAFNLHVKNAGIDVAGSPAVGTAAPGTLYSLTAGTYIVSEDANAAYTQSFSGDCDASGNVTLLAGDNKTCTITNNDIAAIISGGSSPSTGTINVVKIVINDKGGTKTIADFPLSIGGISVISGHTNTFASGSTYTVIETTDPNYTRTFSGDCNINGQVSLNPGDHKFCIITNNDIGEPVIPSPVPPLIDVVKVPTPLALPNGPGDIMYTYTLRNIGTVPVTDVTMVGDTCSPISLFSGDINSDTSLDVNETWEYQCSTTLSVTHTNTVVATGWANGLSTIDIASATVIVGAPVIPPLIHVTKVPSTFTSLVGVGTTTYTATITNPGTIALSNIVLNDDMCSPMKYISGDKNGDLKLDTTESWKYTCQSNLHQTTTNIVIASGEANDITVRDLATATVVVATPIPGLPNAGFTPLNKSTTQNVVILATLILGATSLVVVLRKHRI